MTDALASLRAAPSVVWSRPDRAPEEAVTERVWIGNDPHALALEIAVASWTAGSTPTAAALRRLHAARLGRRAIPLVVLAHTADDKAWMLGPAVEAPPLGPLPVSYAARLAQAALEEPTAGAARHRLMQAMEALLHADTPGLHSYGLFATHELVNGVPRRTDWPAAIALSRGILQTNPRGNQLVEALGFKSEAIPGNALLLSVAGRAPVAVAVLLRDGESFDRESARFAKSPIYHGLELARQRNVRWLVIARGPELRLFPTSPDVGVARRGATQTYFGIDLSLIDNDHAGYLTLTFGAAALAVGGSADQILAASREHAVALEQSLRERIYQRVVPVLAEAIARALATEHPLDAGRLGLAYRMTLRILFRLLFQAYAEDAGLLPLHQNERFSRASLKEHARDLAAHPERPNDPRSTSLWDGLRQVWRVIDRGDSAWGVPAYNGGLFAIDGPNADEGAAIDRLSLTNDVAGPALEALLVDRSADDERGPVDFRSLDVRNFGTIYEGLLEAGLSIAATDLVLAEGAFQPAKAGESPAIHMGEPYFHTKSGDRKASGSYFTPPFIVEHLLERSLGAVLDTHLERVAAVVAAGDQVGAARLLFDFRVADIAMGSGHFLVAALAHVEQKFGAFLENHAIPGVERELGDLATAAAGALKEVGLTSEVDRSALLGRQIAKRCLYGVDMNPMAVELARLAMWVRTFVPGLPMSSLDHQLVRGNSLTGIGLIDEAVTALDPYAPRERRDRRQLISFTGSAIRNALDVARRVLEDAAALKEATSVESRAAAEGYALAQRAAEPARQMLDAAVAVRLGLMSPPTDFDADRIVQTLARSGASQAVTDLLPAHFPVLFPEVFLDEPAGFDVILGNPPWEELHVNADKFWVMHYPGHMSRSDSEKERLRDEYSRDRPELADQLAHLIAETDQARHAILATFPLGGGGDLYRAFCYRYLSLVRPGGQVGVVLPRGATIGASHGRWREEALGSGNFVEVFNLTNKRNWIFESVHPQYQIALLTWSKDDSAPAEPDDRLIEVRGAAKSLDEFARARSVAPLALTREELHRIHTSAGIPAMPAPGVEAVFRKFLDLPRLGEFRGAHALSVGMDGTAGDVRALRRVTPTSAGAMQVVQGRHVELWAPPSGGDFVARPMEGELPLRELGGIAYRQLARSDDSRTFIATWCAPNTFVKETAYWIVPAARDRKWEMALLAWLSSRVFDWYCRTLVDRRILPSLTLNLPTSSLNPSAHETIALAATAEGLLNGRGPRLDGEARIDALAARVAGLDASDLEVILSTFHPTWDHVPHMEAAISALNGMEGVRA